MLLSSCTESRRLDTDANSLSHGNGDDYNRLRWWRSFQSPLTDAPGYYVFCVGLSVVALMIACTWAFNYQFQRAVLSRPIQLGELNRRTLRWATVCAGLGMASVVGLPVLVRSRLKVRVDGACECVRVSPLRTVKPPYAGACVLVWESICDSLTHLTTGVLQYVVVPIAAQQRGVLVLPARDICSVHQRAYRMGTCASVSVDN